MVQPLEVAALALPIANGIIHEFQIADAAEVRNRENGTKDCLQPNVFSFIGQQVHLKEPLVRLPLHLNEVRNRYGGLDFRKIHSLGGAVILNIHSLTLLTAGEPSQ